MLLHHSAKPSPSAKVTVCWQYLAFYRRDWAKWRVGAIPGVFGEVLRLTTTPSVFCRVMSHVPIPCKERQVLQELIAWPNTWGFSPGNGPAQLKEYQTFPSRGKIILQSPSETADHRQSRRHWTALSYCIVHNYWLSDNDLGKTLIYLKRVSV